MRSTAARAARPPAAGATRHRTSRFRRRPVGALTASHGEPAVNHFELPRRRASRRGRAAAPHRRRRSARRSMSIRPPPWSGTTGACATPCRRGPRDALIAYAVKANSNLSVLTTLAELGAGADTVSEGEIRRALAAGVPPERIVFSGVGKTAREIAFALEAGVADSTSSPSRSSSCSRRSPRRLGATAPMSPSASIPTSTPAARQDLHRQGGEQVRRLLARGRAALRQARPSCPASRSRRRLPHRQPDHRPGALRSRLRHAGRPGRATLRAEGLPVERLDLGGGLGVPYFRRAAAAAARRLRRDGRAARLGDLGVQLAFEPGRMIAANAGVLVSRGHPREATARRSLPDGRRGHERPDPPGHVRRLPRHPPGAQPAPRRRAIVDDVVGPVCETGDTFARDRDLPPLQPGDLVAFMTAGAYGAVMAGTTTPARWSPRCWSTATASPSCAPAAPMTT